MPSTEERLKDVLDETQLAMLGTQLLMGLQYRAAFTPGFARLPSAWQWLDGTALMLIESVENLGRYAASWIAGWPNRPSSTAALT